MSEHGDIYVADHKKGDVVLLDDAGRWIRSIAGFTAPLGVAVFEAPPLFDCPEFIDETYTQKCNGKTFLFVGDKGDGSVQLLIERTKAGVLGIGSGEFIMPNGIAVTQDLTIYVVDSLANQVMVYDSSGVQQAVFGSAGFNFPTDIALNEAEGELYITDFHNRRIRVFDLDGGWLRDIFAPLNDQGDPVFWKPAGIGIDSEGNLYIVDNGLSCVAKISSGGELLHTIGYSDGQYWTGELSIPVDAAVYGTHVYVTSNGQRELRIFEVVP
ncbi:NHL repeat-containing protein [Thermodesulfobacteriota bacterium]